MCMTRYFEVAQATLERHQGKVEKFIGDAVMAVFGVPMLHEDDALRALRAATDLKAAIRDLNVDLERTHGVRIEIRTGVNSGEVIAGDPDSRQLICERRRRRRSRAPPALRRAGRDPHRRGDVPARSRRDPCRASRAAHRQGQARPRHGLPAARGRPRRTSARAPVRLADGGPHAGAVAARERVLALRAASSSCHLLHGARPGGRGEVSARGGSARGHRRPGPRAFRQLPPYGEGITFWPVLEIVKQLTGIADDDSPAEAQRRSSPCSRTRPTRTSSPRVSPS